MIDLYSASREETEEALQLTRDMNQDELALALVRTRRSESLLHEGLNLCVRARKMDAQDRTNTQRDISLEKDWWTPENTARRAARHNEIFPDHPMAPKCATMQIWAIDQYEKDLADWERRARAHLTQP